MSRDWTAGWWSVVTNSGGFGEASRGVEWEGVARAVSQARLDIRTTPRPYAPRMFEHVTPSRSATRQGPREILRMRVPTHGKAPRAVGGWCQGAMVSGLSKPQGL